MNVKTQIFIDQYIVKPFTYILNFIVRIVGKILHINHDLNKDFKRIAICKFKGMGSIIQATPMIQAIRAKFPDAEIIFVTTTANIKILEHIPMIDRVVAIDDKGILKFIPSSLKALATLIRIRPEVYFDLEIYSDFSALFALLTLSKNRIGFYLRSSSYRTGIYTHMMFFNPRAPVSKAYLQMAQLLNCDTNFELYPLNIGEKKASETKKYVVINPNASDLRIERRWPKDRFISLIDTILKEDSTIEIHLIGSKDELAYTDSIVETIGDKRLINTAGKLSIQELILEIENAYYMVSNDTGPMHIAFSTDTPIICLFGPCSPDQYGMSKNAHIIYKSVYCSPCVHDFITPPCKGNNICMKLITVEEVHDKIKRLVSNTITDSYHHIDFIYEAENKVLGEL